MIKIKTDGKWKPFLFRYGIPEKVITDQFSHLSLENDQDGYFKYRGHYYHLSDFMVVDPRNEELKHWEGHTCDTYFSGVLLKVSRDGEEYQVGSYYM